MLPVLGVLFAGCSLLPSATTAVVTTSVVPTVDPTTAPSPTAAATTVTLATAAPTSASTSASPTEGAPTLVTVGKRLKSAAQVDELPVDDEFKSYLKKMIVHLRDGEFLQVDLYRTDGWASGMYAIEDSDGIFPAIWHKDSSGWGALKVETVAVETGAEMVSCASLTKLGVPAELRRGCV